MIKEKDIKQLVEHMPHYLPLFGIFSFGLTAFSFFSYDRSFQAASAIAVAVAYVAWGVIHHYLHKDLHLSVVIEYLVVALLGLVIVFSLVFQA